ncbi:MAG: NUDIX hydrolase [Patescibacteria group bacterium]|nr:NUDIX hydrolase [Patescibacteria group bacterium]
MKHTKVFNNDNKLQKAGGLITREANGVKVVLLISSDSISWSFPKGHLEEGESLWDCALRECKEETGLDLRIEKELPPLEYQNSKTSDNIIVHLYQMSILGGELQKESEDVHFMWCPISKIANIFDYPSLTQYASKVIKEFL